MSFKFHNRRIDITGKIKLTQSEIKVAKLNFPIADMKLCIAKENHLVKYVVANIIRAGIAIEKVSSFFIINRLAISSVKKKSIKLVTMEAIALASKQYFSIALTRV